jgi:hypothetical protein
VAPDLAQFDMFAAQRNIGTAEIADLWNPGGIGCTCQVFAITFGDDDSGAIGR